MNFRTVAYRDSGRRFLRFFAMSCAALLILSVMLSLSPRPVYAEGGSVSGWASADDSNPAAGDSVTVTIGARQTDMQYLQFYVNWDSSWGGSGSAKKVFGALEPLAEQVSFSINLTAPGSGSCTVSWKVLALMKDCTEDTDSGSLGLTVSTSSPEPTSPPTESPDEPNNENEEPDETDPPATEPEVTQPEDDEVANATTIEPSSLPSPTPTAAAENEDSVYLRINGLEEKRMTVASTENLLAPEGYNASTVQINDKDHAAFTSEKGLPLLYLRDDKNESAFYLYDATQKSVFKYFAPIAIKTKKGDARVLPLDMQRPGPEYQFDTYSIDGKAMSVFKLLKNTKEFVLVKAEMNGAKPELYVLQNENGALTLTLLSSKEGQTLLNPVSPTPTGILAASITPIPSISPGGLNSKEDTMVTWWIVVLLILLAAAIGVAIFLLIRRKRAEKFEEDFWPEIDEHVYYDESGEEGGPDQVAGKNAEQAHKPLPELQPNNFDEVDNYFANKPESKVASRAASMGVRKLQVPPQVSNAGAQEEDNVQRLSDEGIRKPQIPHEDDHS